MAKSCGDAVNLSYSIAPSELRWAADLFRYVQAFKAGTFASDEVYSQFGWLIVPEITAHGASGPFTAYFAIKAADASNNFDILRPITDVAVWSVEDHLPATNLLFASGLSLAISDVLLAPSANALERLIFRGDDNITYLPATPDNANDLLHGWAGNDDFDVWGSGGNDTIHGDAGNDRISIQDFAANSLQGVAGAFFGYGDAGNDTLLGDDRGDSLFGGSGRDSLLGYDGNDGLAGGAGNDTLNGGIGRDSLSGEAGNDILMGSVGADLLSGGGGADLFVFTWGGPVPHFDSGPGVAGRDVISDFTPGSDHLRFLHSGLAPVTLIGSAAFTAINQVRWVSSGGNTIVYVNGDTDPAAEMSVALTGIASLQDSDFL